ncbi:proline-rich transmembrane protein 1-like [Alosa sapidissima]|uniref:proline-rich transmembrane protein 1-like n=1 Tax=Alosa sapidissima TaxID=34773 RepID=UPI001C09E1BD|nr:proline-rich transmembrane protein 1-like [Alosa sapidissima]
MAAKSGPLQRHQQLCAINKKSPALPPFPALLHPTAPPPPYSLSPCHHHHHHHHHHLHRLPIAASPASPNAGGCRCVPLSPEPRNRPTLCLHPHPPSPCGPSDRRGHLPARWRWLSRRLPGSSSAVSSSRRCHRCRPTGIMGPISTTHSIKKLI